MKAIAIVPGRPRSARLTQIPEPTIDSVPGGRGVLVKVLRVGVDGTDREIYEAEYGKAPEGQDVLVTGHEGLGRVEAVGPAVKEVAPGDLVVATVRRPGKSFYDRLGYPDFTTDGEYYERGINLLNGFLAEKYVEDATYLVKLPAVLRKVGVLMEPFSIVQKGIQQAFEAQRRLHVWRPARAAVMGAGSVGLLATLALRLRGLRVTTFARERKPAPNAALVEELGATYVSVQDASITEVARKEDGYDLIFEATGVSAVAFESMRAVAKNGVLVLASVTGGDHKLEVPADRINLEFVLGNKLMLGTVNASKENFESGVRDLVEAQAMHPGWLDKLLTNPVHGLENYEQLYQALTTAKGVIKAFCVVSED